MSMSVLKAKPEKGSFLNFFTFCFTCCLVTRVLPSIQPRFDWMKPVRWRVGTGFTGTAARTGASVGGVRGVARYTRIHTHTRGPMSGRRVGFCLSDKKRRRMNLGAFADLCA